MAGVTTNVSIDHMQHTHNHSETTAEEYYQHIAEPEDSYDRMEHAEVLADAE